jgi:serine O-acetyltransferase
VIGERSVIGANAVVVKDVPADSVAVGIPATVTPRKKITGSSPAARKKATRATDPGVDVAWTDPAVFI